MLDIKLIRDNPDLVRENCKKKFADPGMVDTVVDLDLQRRSIIREVEELKARRNAASLEVAASKKRGVDATSLIEEVRLVGDRIKQLDDELRSVDGSLLEVMSWLPNIAHESVPFGASAEDNVEVRRSGECDERSYRVDHLAVGAQLGLLDFERGAKVTGSGFGFLTGMGARLERALIAFFLDRAAEAGYKEVVPPFVVNEASLFGTGQLPKSAEEMYHVAKDDLYLIPTAEVPITNYHRDEVFSPGLLPLSYAGYSACFRREAGSHGKETRGFLRVHQFNKVELVHFCEPDGSYEVLDNMVSHVERLLTSLELTYRVLLLCTGDMTFGGSKTYDVEVWAPAEQRWLEVSSCTNFESFQARRANIRYKSEAQSKPEFVHTLNGSGIATSRILVAMLEQHQTEQGTITIPEELRSYCGFDHIR
jgi:seryl-tRNA synthetase